MWWLADYLAKVATTVLGKYGVAWASVIAIAALTAFIISWHRGRVKEGRPGVQNWHFILIGIAGTWFFFSITAIAAAYWIYVSPSSSAADTGPLKWISAFTLEGGIGGHNVFSIRILGANTSEQPVHLKEARIISLVDGTPLDTEIVAFKPDGSAEVVALDRVQLIAPGAPIELVVKFGPVDPNNPPKVLGIPAKDFLDRWRQFKFTATDDVRSYSFTIKEDAMMPFFKGQVGPRVALKP